MTFSYWLYLSKSTIPDEHAAAAVNELVRRSQVRNAALGISGALVFAGGHFGQFIEGRPEELLALKSLIMEDKRHTDIVTIADGRAIQRRFDGWSLVYSGASVVVSRALQWALRDSAQGSAHAGRELLKLMDELVTPK